MVRAWTESSEKPWEIKNVLLLFLTFSISSHFGFTSNFIDPLIDHFSPVSWFGGNERYSEYLSSIPLWALTVSLRFL
jgi:hypothetical protein